MLYLFHISEEYQWTLRSSFYERLSYQYEETIYFFLSLWTKEESFEVNQIIHIFKNFAHESV
jgi:hypothetical protein